MTPFTTNLDAPLTADPAPVESAVYALQEVQPGPEARTITGTILLYGVWGVASMGSTLFEAGALHAPSPLDKVKLLLDHDHSVPVGYLADLEDVPAVEGRAASVRATFRVPDDETGQRVLAMARNRLRDGLSVGVLIEDYAKEADTRFVIRRARLNEVSLVALPAFEDARVDVAAAAARPHVTAAVHNEHGQTAAPAAERKAVVADDNKQPVTVEAAAPNKKPEGNEDKPEPKAANTDQPATKPAEKPAPEPKSEPAATVKVDVPGQYQAAPGAHFVQAPPVLTGTPKIDLASFSTKIAEHLNAGHSAAYLTAALADIIPSATPGNSGIVPQYVTELWAASNYRRPLIDSIKKAALTSLTVLGPRWVSRPQVGEYAGNKTEIPSNPFTREMVQVAVKRFAGGWDIDRAYADFGDSQFIRMVLDEATNDYRRKSEAYVAATLLAGATKLDADPVTAGVQPHATLVAALAAIGVQAATNGAEISFVAMAPDVWAKFVVLKDSEVPWWLRAQGQVNLGTTTGSAGSVTFTVNAALPAGHVLAGDGNAATFYEVEPPIRVQALDVAHAGVDVAVYGYGAALVNDSRAIYDATVA